MVHMATLLHGATAGSGVRVFAWVQNGVVLNWIGQTSRESERAYHPFSEFFTVEESQRLTVGNNIW